jgi:hypothetical protein
MAKRHVHAMSVGYGHEARRHDSAHHEHEQEQRPHEGAQAGGVMEWTSDHAQ